MLRIVIPSLTGKILTNVDSCPVPYRLLVVSGGFLGECRHFGVEKCGEGLIVMLDSDIILSKECWKILLGTERGEFSIGVVNVFGATSHVSTRVFAIHFEDYLKVGGFDCNIKYTFEDGDFYYRAVASGLRCRGVSSKYFRHIDHKPRSFSGSFKVFYNVEAAKMLVKYKRAYYSNLWSFFGLRSNLKSARVTVIKGLALLYYLMKQL